MKYYFVPENGTGKPVKVGANVIPPNVIAVVPDKLAHLPDEALEIVDGKVLEIPDAVMRLAAEMEIDISDNEHELALEVSNEDAINALIHNDTNAVAAMKTKLDAQKLVTAKRKANRGKPNFFAIVKDGGLYTIKEAKKGHKPNGFVAFAPPGLVAGDEKFITVTEKPNVRPKVVVNWAAKLATITV